MTLWGIITGGQQHVGNLNAVETTTQERWEISYSFGSNLEKLVTTWQDTYRRWQQLGSSLEEGKRHV